MNMICVTIFLSFIADKCEFDPPIMGHGLAAMLAVCLGEICEAGRRKVPGPSKAEISTRYSYRFFSALSYMTAMILVGVGLAREFQWRISAMSCITLLVVLLINIGTHYSVSDRMKRGLRNLTLIGGLASALMCGFATEVLISLNIPGSYFLVAGSLMISAAWILFTLSHCGGIKIKDVYLQHLALNTSGFISVGYFMWQYTILIN
jgi:hypothetical protein